MECVRGILSSFLSARREISDRSVFLLENGSKLLEGGCSVPISNFSAEELIKATTNFGWQHLVYEDAFYKLYRGSFGKRPVLVKKYKSDIGRNSLVFPAGAIHDIVIASQMSSQKNVLKLIGFCLEFETPALVYEDVGEWVKIQSLSWRSRLSMANDIASVVVSLHTLFSTPIIHRNLKLQDVIVDRFGVTKLFDFSFSIAIPPGESQVEDAVVGTGSFVEPQYCATGILTEKTDVYQFGMILLELLTGERSLSERGGNYMFLNDLVKDYVERDRLIEIVDTRIRGGGGGAEQERQWQAFAELALRCLEKEREDRPEMVDVAKELEGIQRFVDSSSAQP